MTNIRLVSLAGALVYPEELPERPEDLGAIVVRSPGMRIFIFRGRLGQEVLFEEVRYDHASLPERSWSPRAVVPGHKCRCAAGELCHRHLTAALWRRIMEEVEAVAASSPSIGQSELVGRVMGRLAVAEVRVPDEHVRMAVAGLCGDRAHTTRGLADSPSVAVR